MLSYYKTYFAVLRVPYLATALLLLRTASLFTHAYPGTSFIKVEKEEGVREAMIARYKIISGMKKIHREQEPSVSFNTRSSRQSMKTALEA